MTFSVTVDGGIKMENHEPLFNEVKDIVSGIRALMDRAYQQYSSLVDAVIKDEITDINYQPD